MTWPQRKTREITKLRYASEFGANGELDAISSGQDAEADPPIAEQPGRDPKSHTNDENPLGARRMPEYH